MNLPKFIPEYRRHIDEEIRAREPKIILPKIIQPIEVEVVEVQQPVEVLQEPEAIKEPKELIELRRMYLAGETDMSEEMYIRQTEGLMRWWAETGAKQQQN